MGIMTTTTTTIGTEENADTQERVFICDDLPKGYSDAECDHVRRELHW